MSDRFEQSVIDWYEHARTSNLEYLNLENKTQKISHHDLSNNINCIYDRLQLFAKVSLKYFHSIQNIENRLVACETKIQKFQKESTKNLKQLSTEIRDIKPLTKKEVRELVQEIAQQPKLVEEEALKISEDVKKQLQKVEDLLHQIKSLIS